tara:strand:- start:257 stop:691 length:435 start_codon:yes stop_codon:yes gene_type:complete
MVEPTNGNIKLKVDVESLKKDVESIQNINDRLNTAIDKLTDLSTSIKSMLAVHEEKLSRQDKVDEIIFEKLRERQQEIQEVHTSLKTEMATSEKRLLIEIKSLKLEIGNRVTTLERYKWLILGGAIVIGWILSTNFKFIVQMMS